MFGDLFGDQRFASSLDQVTNLALQAGRLLGAPVVCFVMA
jgi:hypothetical protein